MIKKGSLLPVLVFTLLLVSFRYADSWTIFTSDMGHYAISFPGDPSEHSEFDTTEDNVPFSVHFLSYVQPDKSEAYILGWIDMSAFYPKGKDITQILNENMDDATKSMNAKNVTILNTNTTGSPYIEFAFSSDNSIGKERIYIINKFKYSILTLGSKNTGVTPSMDKFILSFQHLP